MTTKQQHTPGPVYDEERTVLELMEFVKKDPRHSVYEIRRLRAESAALRAENKRLREALSAVMRDFVRVRGSDNMSGPGGLTADGARALLRELGEAE